MSYPHHLKTFLVMLFFFQGCSLSGLSPGATTGTYPNDPRPSGTLLAQGAFVGQNSQTVAGNALIFYDGSNFILTLQSLTAPSETGLLIQVFTLNSQTAAYAAPLLYNSGTKNYTFSAATGGVRFSNVYLYSQQNRLIYGSVNLTQTTTSSP